MITHYLSFSISITFLSWIVGMFFSGVLGKTEFYKNLSNLNLIKSETINKRIGIGIFKWIVKNTPFKYLNSNIKLKDNKISLSELRKEMTFSEINHLVGFGFVTVFALVKLINGDFLFAFIFMVMNILMNLYPSLLQQENKRQIDRMIKKFR